MNDPKRLLDDGDLDPRLSSALEDVALGTSAGDLSTLKARVLEAAMAGVIPAGATASAAAADAGWSAASSSGGGALASLGALSATSTGVAGLVLGAFLGASGHALYVAGDAVAGDAGDAVASTDSVVSAVALPREATSSHAMDVPARDDVGAADLSLVEEGASSDAAAKSPLATGRGAPPVVGSGGRTVARAELRRQSSEAAVAAATVPSPAVERPLVTTTTTTATESTDALSLQLRLYERGEDALKSRRFEAALRELDTYLASFPNGELEREARLARLDALLGMGRGEEALSDIVVLRSDARFKSHGPRLLALEIEALTTLGRCDEAEALFARAWLDARSAAAARERVARCRTR